MRRVWRSPRAGVPAGALIGALVTVALWTPLASEPTHSLTSALVVAGGLGLATLGTVATIWWGLTRSRDDS